RFSRDWSSDVCSSDLARRELGLHNVEVVHARVEQYRKAPSQIISRAFAALPDMLELLGPLMQGDVRLLAMKAAAADQEMAALPRSEERRVGRECRRGR